MTQEQLARLQLVSPLIDSGTLPMTVAARMLKISERQLRRYLGGFALTPRVPWNRIPEEVKQYVTSLKEEFSNYLQLPMDQ